MSRKVRISVCAFRQGRGVADLESPAPDALANAMDMARLAKAEGADLAVFPEVFALLTCHDSALDFAEPLDGPTFSTIAAIARNLDMFIAANHPTLIDGQKHNTTVLFDRCGEVAGVYHKAYPTIGELERGVVPGDGPVVVDTELGRIGFAICYDLNFAELRLAYRDLRPDVILFCSMFRGGLQTRWWAFETRSHFVGCVVDPCSRIVNPIGRLVREIDDFTRQMTATLELDCGVFHYDYNNLKLSALREKWGSQLEIDFAEPEGVMLLSAVGETPLSRIVEDMNLEPVENYFIRARNCIDQTRRAQPPAPGPAPW